MYRKKRPYGFIHDIFRIIDSTTSSSEDVVLLFIMQLDVKIK